MDNTLVKAVVMGTVGAAGAYLINVVFEYAPDNGIQEWGITWIAFVVGSYIGLTIRNNRDKSEKAESKSED